MSVFFSAIFPNSVYFKPVDTYPDLKTLRKVHCRIILEDLHCNSSLGVKLMRAYAALKDVASARKVFEEIPERNVIIINVMIRSYVNNWFYREGIQVFGMMYGFHVRPDHYTFPSVLKACSCSGNIVIGKKIHGSATRVGLSSTLFVGNGLVSMYGKCGFLAEARLVLDEMSRRDVVSWNSLVAGYAQIRDLMMLWRFVGNGICEDKPRCWHDG